MKKRKFKWLKILIVVFIIIIILALFIGNIINKVSNNINDISDFEISDCFTDYTVEEQNMTAYVKGTGEITSFNIQTIDVPTYGSIKETFVNDGDIVTAKQKIFRVIVDGYSQNINSPIDGMYFETEINNSKVYQVYDLNNIGIEILVSENDVASLKNGQKAFVKITALNKEVEGSVIYVSKLPTDGKFKVKIKIEYNDEIKFGYGASVSIVTSEKENVLVIPYSALQIDNNNKYYVIKSDYKRDFYNNYMYNEALPETSKTYVEVGIITNSQVEIISGLNSGDIIEEWNW